MIKTKKISDKDLMVTLQNNEATSRQKEKAFNDLYACYNRGIFTFLIKKTEDVTLVEDLVMMTFQKVYEKISSYNSEAGAISTWIYTIARNLYVDHMRSEKLKVVSIETLSRTYSDGHVQEFQIESDYDSSLEEAKNFEAKMTRVKQAIVSLEDKDVRNIMFYRYVKGLSVKEIENKLGLENNSTTRIKIHRGKKIVKDLLVRL